MMPHGDSATVLVDAFLADRNRHTLAAYRHDLDDFVRFAGAETAAAAADLLTHERSVARTLACAYKQSLVDRGLSVGTVNRRLATLRALVRMARARGIVMWDLAITNQTVRTPRATPLPSAQEVATVLTMLERRGSPKAIRDRAIIRLLYDAALQRAEVVSLDREHLDLDAGTVALPHRDHVGREPVTLPGPTKEALRAWLAVRGEWFGPLFTNSDHGKKGDGRLTDRAIYAMVRRHGEEAGVQMRPHDLRRAAIAQTLARSDGDVLAAQRFSRHKAIRTVKAHDVRRMERGGDLPC